MGDFLQAVPARNYPTALVFFWNVLPLSRALTNWSKWRVYLGFVMAMPHLLGNLVGAIASADREQAFRKIMQRM